MTLKSAHAKVNCIGRPHSHRWEGRSLASVGISAQSLNCHLSWGQVNKYPKSCTTHALHKPFTPQSDPERQALCMTPSQRGNGLTLLTDCEFCDCAFHSLANDCVLVYKR